METLLKTSFRKFDVVIVKIWSNVGPNYCIYHIFVKYSRIITQPKLLNLESRNLAWTFLLVYMYPVRTDLGLGS